MIRRSLAILLSGLIAAGPASAQNIPRVLLASPAVGAPAAASVSVRAAAAIAPTVAALPALPMPAALPAPILAGSPARSAALTRAIPSVELSGAAFFDGARSAADASSPFAHPSTAPRLQPRRLKLHESIPPIYKAFRDTMIYTSFAAAAIPVVWGAAPLSKETYLLPAASAAGLVVLGGLNLARWIGRRLFEPPSGRPAPPKKRERACAAVLGLIYGAVIGIGVQHYTGPVIEEARAAENLVVKKKLDVRAMSVAAMSEETVRTLSANPVGRAILEKYRDRGGVVRLPTFFLEDGPSGLAARYDGADDGIRVNLQYLRENYGRPKLTMTDVLGDEAFQRRIVVDLQAMLAHELTHGVQARRLPTSRETLPFTSAMEREYEAFGNEYLYVHETLQADPHADVEEASLADYRESLGGDLLKSLREKDSEYAGTVNGHVEGAYWRSFYADLNARWPKLRVEGYVLLARRELPRNPIIARSYLDKARAVAARFGLPGPELEIPARP